MVSNKQKKYYDNLHGNNNIQLAHIPMSQRFPVKPEVQLQLKSFIRSRHVPLTQGLGWHSSISGKERKSFAFTFLIMRFLCNNNNNNNNDNDNDSGDDNDNDNDNDDDHDDHDNHDNHDNNDNNDNNNNYNNYKLY